MKKPSDCACLTRTWWGALRYSIVVFCLSGIFFAAIAQAVDHVTFSWKANPSEDSVIGYRLYYGSTSRYDATGALKENFHYERYLDFTEGEMCQSTASGPVCSPYDASLVSCEHLTGDHPRCTVHNLEGWTFFAMTAYNSIAESAYTHELKAYFSTFRSYLPASESTSDPASRAVLLNNTLLTVYKILFTGI